MRFSGKGEKGTLDESVWVQILAPALTSYRLLTSAHQRAPRWAAARVGDQAGRSQACHRSPESLGVLPPRVTPAALIATRLLSRSEVLLFPVSF